MFCIGQIDVIFGIGQSMPFFAIGQSMLFFAMLLFWHRPIDTVFGICQSILFFVAIGQSMPFFGIGQSMGMLLAWWQGSWDGLIADSMVCMRYRGLPGCEVCGVVNASRVDD